MPETLLKVENLGEMRRLLLDLPADIGKKILKKAVFEQGRYLWHEVVQRVPVGDTGLLADSIKLKPARAGPGEVAAKVTAEKFYALFLERGFNHQASKKFIIKPFMRPAIDESRDRLYKVMEDQVKKGIQNYFKRKARGKA